MQIRPDAVAGASRTTPAHWLQGRVTGVYKHPRTAIRYGDRCTSEKRLKLDPKPDERGPVYGGRLCEELCGPGSNLSENQRYADLAISDIQRFSNKSPRGTKEAMAGLAGILPEQRAV